MEFNSNEFYRKFKGAELIYVRKNPEIGGGVKIGRGVLIDCQEKVVIGEWSFIAKRTMLMTGSHDYTYVRQKRQASITPKPIYIGKGVWIASGCIVIGGVTIGDDAVVGAGSVVVKDIPSGELWAGNPARLIKKISFRE